MKHGELIKVKFSQRRIDFSMNTKNFQMLQRNKINRYWIFNLNMLSIQKKLKSYSLLNLIKKALLYIFHFCHNTLTSWKSKKKELCTSETISSSAWSVWKNKTIWLKIWKKYARKWAQSQLKLRKKMKLNLISKSKVKNQLLLTRFANSILLGLISKKKKLLKSLKRTYLQKWNDKRILKQFFI